eukprot:GEMP01023660.1.p1 GENE.GEMP01023660.1~~GEMP01023660.1.p1  ORF type:complete len:360 (+),score=43.56 GEMP01023660.1:361-1440(+)
MKLTVARKIPWFDKSVSITSDSHIPTNGCILSPNVEIFRGATTGYSFLWKPVPITGVVSFAAFNKNPSVKDSPVDAPEDEEVYLDKVQQKWRATLVGARKMGAEVVVIPDVGCGVFKNEPFDMGSMLNVILCECRGWFKEIIILGKQEFVDSALLGLGNIIPFRAIDKVQNLKTSSFLGRLTRNMSRSASMPNHEELSEALSESLYLTQSNPSALLSAFSQLHHPGSSNDSRRQFSSVHSSTSSARTEIYPRLSLSASKALCASASCIPPPAPPLEASMLSITDSVTAMGDAPADSLLHSCDGWIAGIILEDVGSNAATASDNTNKTLGTTFLSNNSEVEEKSYHISMNSSRRRESASE